MNVTVELVAWNATAAPAVSHSGVYALAALGSKRFLTFDLGDTLHEAGASADHIAEYFLHCTVGPGFSRVPCSQFPAIWSILHNAGACKL